MGFDKYTSTATVNAEQVTEQKSVITPNGPMAAQPGQWEVRYPDGNVQVVDDEQFTATFEKGKDGEAEVSHHDEEKVGVTTVPDSEPDSDADTEEETEPSPPEPKPEKTVTKAPPRTR